MYTQQDFSEAKGYIWKDVLFTVPVLILAIVGYVLGIHYAMRFLVYGMAALFFAVCCFAWGMYLWPHIHYYRFLLDMKTGLTRTIEGRFEHLGEAEETQDGVRVMPVYMFLDNEQDERILYINVDKLSALPEAGREMKALCYGRHIREIVR